MDESSDGTNLHLTFGIPRGTDGTNGASGEVSMVQLTTAIGSAVSGTSSNTNAVATLDAEPNDPPSFADYEARRAKMNELILNGRR